MTDNKLFTQPYIDKDELKSLIKQSVDEVLDERERLKNIPDEPYPEYECSLQGLAGAGTCLGSCFGVMFAPLMAYKNINMPLGVTAVITISVFALIGAAYYFLYSGRVKVQP